MTSTVISTTTRALAPRPRSRALLDLGQGLVVLAFAAAEWAGLRRATAPGAAAT